MSVDDIIAKPRSLSEPTGARAKPFLSVWAAVALLSITLVGCERPPEPEAAAPSSAKQSSSSNGSSPSHAFRCANMPVYALAPPADLRISEAVAKSEIPDYLDGADWIELQNQGNSAVCLGLYSLQDDKSGPAALPDVLLKPGEYFVIPASDRLPNDSSAYVPFKLGKSDSLTLLFGSDAVDQLSWQRGEAKQGRSVGRLNDEKATLYPTPNSANVPYTLFSDSDVFKVKITLPEASYRHLMRNPVDERWYKADFELNGAVIKDVAVATKGSSSLRNIARLRPHEMGFGRYGFKVDFNKYKEQKFMGMKRLAFNSGYGDPSMMRDAIAYRLMKEVDMPASELSFVDLWFAGRHLGVYQMVESVDGEYVEKYFPEDKQKNVKGDLYKAFSSLQWEEGQSITHFTRGRFPQLKLITNDETTGTDQEGTAVMALLRSINSGSAELIDTDLMPRYIAAMTLISNYDSYFANLGNYFLYEQRAKNRFTMLPWDFNLSLGRVIKEGKVCEDPVVLINHPTIAPIQERPMIARVLEREDLRVAYHRHLKTLLDNLFNPSDMRQYVQNLQKLIDPYVEDDPTSFYTYRQWKQSFDEAVTGETDHFGKAGPLLPFIDARYQNVKRQLSGEISAGSIDSGPCPK